mmetsp:Transcript_12583/g.22309  ORF Transcript_12583/g.22309 Transcript_12583/m.22309 type:complete len:169 (-) Transcript_12583:16-522(-)
MGNGVVDLEHGLAAYTALSIHSSKLVLGVSLGGSEWRCRNFDGTNFALDYCEAELVGGDGYRGVNCSDAVADGCHDISGCAELAEKSVASGYDNYVKLPWFNYIDESEVPQLRQVWYEDASSLTKKWKMGGRFGIRGVGPWQFSKIDYNNTAEVEEIWGTFCAFLDCD